MSDAQLSINIGQEAVGEIVQARITSLVAEALTGGNHKRLVEQIVGKMMSQKVAKDGKVSRSDYENKYTWLEMTVGSMVQDAVRKAIKDTIERQKPQIEEAIAKALAGKKRSSNLAKAMVDGLGKCLQKDWRLNLQVAFDSTDN